MGFPSGSEVKNMHADAGDTGLTRGLGRYPGEGNGNPLQYSCLENPTDRGAWWATVHGVTELDTTERVISFSDNVNVAAFSVFWQCQRDEFLFVSFVCLLGFRVVWGGRPRFRTLPSLFSEP